MVDQDTFCCLHSDYLNREVGARDVGSQGAEQGKGFCHCKLTMRPYKEMAGLSYVRNPATASRLVTVNASIVRKPSLCSKGTDLVPKPAPLSSRSTPLVFQVFVLSSLSQRFKELGHSQMCWPGIYARDPLLVSSKPMHKTQDLQDLLLGKT